MVAWLAGWLVPGWLAGWSLVGCLVGSWLDLGWLVFFFFFFFFFVVSGCSEVTGFV